MASVLILYDASKHSPCPIAGSRQDFQAIIGMRGSGLMTSTLQWVNVCPLQTTCGLIITTYEFLGSKYC